MSPRDPSCGAAAREEREAPLPEFHVQQVRRRALKTLAQPGPAGSLAQRRRADVSVWLGNTRQTSRVVL